MAGIYIHVPFCKSRCTYCAFYSTTGLEQRQRYVDAVCREMMMRSQEAEQRVDTVYVGGGTPSQLTAEQLRQLFSQINKVWGKVLSSSPEITIEANPDDVTQEFVRSLRALPVNRVSMGVQSFSDERLRFVNRRHTSAQAVAAVEQLREAGFDNISIDLMYGFPDESFADWLADIDRALSLEPQHISAYCLSYEEGTALQRWMTDNGKQPMDEEQERQMYYTLIDRLDAAGYEHYEISNFAKPGLRSRHNSSYWTGVPYVGLGAAAHSFDGRSRRWNVSDISQYMEGIEQGRRVCEEELMDEETRYNDLITVALRTREGLCLDQLSESQREYCLSQASRFVEGVLLCVDGDRLRLTRNGLFVSNMVMSELMDV